MDATQYYKITLSSPEKAEKKYSSDITKYVDNVTTTDEDGLLQFLDFDMRNAYLMMDIVSIGMKVIMAGGTLEEDSILFSGQVEEVVPDFRPEGEIRLRIRCVATAGGKLGVGIRDLIYPSKNHPMTWGTSELMYSDIITNLAEDAGIKVEAKNLEVRKDIKAGFAKGTVRQRNMTDWFFMNFLARKINCTVWIESVNGVPTLYLKDNSTLVNTLGRNTFYFVNTDSVVGELPSNDPQTIQRRIDAINSRTSAASDLEIQILKANVRLDSKNGKGRYKQKIDSETGKVSITTDHINEETGERERWILDEEKVRALSSEERTELIGLFTSGKITWEGERGTVSAKQYFKREIIIDSSREGEPNNTEVEVADGALTSDGITTENGKKEHSGSKSFKTVIDNKKLAKLSSEKRSAIMGRIARGEITEEDKKYYTVVDTTPKSSKDDHKAGADNTSQSSNTKAKAITNSNKRDDGFTITADCYLVNSIEPRKSHILEGLGKYSGKYYLYKVTKYFGTRHSKMRLIFTK